MNMISYSKARETLADMMDRVCAERVPEVITRRGHESVVVLPKQDYDGLLETLHLLRSPRNAQRLLDAVAAANRGEHEEHELIEVE